MKTDEMSKPKVVAVSGADGFIGRNLCATLNGGGFIVRPIYGPRWQGNCAESDHCFRVDFNRELPPNRALEGCDVLIHLAGIAHRFNGTDRGAIARINGHVPSSLARRAHQLGVRRFLFMSSAAVIPLIGTKPTGRMNDDAQEDEYGCAKLVAERELQEVASETGIEAVVLRPPAVYGPGAPGRLSQLMRLIHLGVPFPSACNKRSLIGIENLVDFLILCSRHPAAAGQAFSLSDCEPSSSEIIRLLAQGMRRTPVFLPLPQSVVSLCFGMFGRARSASHYFDSFVVDSDAAHRLLGWVPRKPAPEGLRETGAHFAQSVRDRTAKPRPNWID